MDHKELEIEIKNNIDRIIDFGDGPLEFETRFVEALIREAQKAESAKRKVEILLLKYQRLFKYHYSAAATEMIVKDLEVIKAALK